jgi:hypothetical protein
MSKQTAVDFLIEELGEYFPHEIGGIHLMVEQAKEMEKQQIIDARQDGFNRCFRKGDRKEVPNEQYYNETFK